MSKAQTSTHLLILTDDWCIHIIHVILIRISETHYYCLENDH